MTQAVAAVTAPGGSHRTQVQALLSDVFRLMEYPATFDFKDMPDGGIGVALHFASQDLPGINPGQRSSLVDCLQFIVNKVVNRPNMERHWVTLGVGRFPEPRGVPPVQAAPVKAPAAPVKAPPPKTSAPAAGPAAKAWVSNPQAKALNRPVPSAPPQRASHPHDEASMTVTPDAAFAAVVQRLAKKSAECGRVYALMQLSQDDRARALQAAKGLPGVSLKAEGEGHWRRVTFVPAKPQPMPKKTLVMPDYDDE